MDAFYWVEGEEFAKMVNVAAEQFRRVMPGGEVWVYTSEAPDSLDRSDLYRVEEMPVLKTMRPMVANLHAQVHFALTKFRNPTLFLDADTLVQKPFQISSMADLMVTWRDETAEGVNSQLAKMMPYNYGVLGANPSYEATEAFIWMREQVRGYHAGLQDWYGNQVALRELVGPVISGAEVDPPTRDFELVVDQQPCAAYNYTPKAEDEDIAQKYVIHVKGDRKAWFEPIARRIAA